MGEPRRVGQNVRLLRHNRAMWEKELDGWVQHLRAAGCSPATIRLRREHLARALTWLDAPSPWVVEHAQLVEYLAVHDWAPETRKSVRASLRGFYAWAEEAEHVAVDPARRLPRVSVPTGKPKPTPTDVVESALSRATARERLMVMLAAYAGLRRAEIAALHSRDVSAESLRIKGKGGRTRIIPLHPDLASALSGRTGYLFPGADDGHLSPDRVGRILTNLLGGGYTAHTLRHRFATRAYAGERDLLAVQDMLGHSSVATTQRYTQPPDDAKRRAILSVA